MIEFPRPSLNLPQEQDQLAIPRILKRLQPPAFANGAWLIPA